MKIKVLLIICILFLSSSFGLKVTAQFLERSQTVPNNYRDIIFPNFDYNIPNPKNFRHKIHPKSIAYFLPNKELNLVKFSLSIPTRNIPKNLEELALYQLFESTVFTGGFKNISAKKISDTLEFMASSIDLSLNPYQTNITLNCFNEDVYKLLSLLENMILYPNFDSTHVDIQKQNIIQNIIQNKNTPRGLLEQYYPSLMYQDNPLIWSLTPNLFDTIQSKDLKKWKFKGFKTHTKFIFSVSGNFDPNIMQKKLNHFTQNIISSFSNLTDKEQYPLLRFKKEGLKKFVSQNFSQSTIQIGYKGIQRPHPDYYPLTLIHYILGGGLQSRLSEKIRSEHGLAYTVYSSIESNYNHKGSSYIFLQTKKESTSKALKLIFSEIQLIKKKGFKQQELDNAKSSLLQSLYSLFKNNSSIATTFSQNEAWGRDLDHFQKYLFQLNRISLDKIKNVFHQYFIKQKPSILIISPQEVLEQPYFREENYQILKQNNVFLMPTFVSLS